MSAKPWQDYNYDVFADNISKIRNELKLEQKFAIVGFSMGGAIVMRYVEILSKHFVTCGIHGCSSSNLLLNERAILMDRIEHFATRLLQD